MPTTESGQMVSQGTALKQIAAVLHSDEVKAAIAEQIPLAMRQTLDANRAVRAAWQNILSNADEMVKCEPKSIAKAITEAVTHGLIVDGMTGQAYLVRFGNQCVFMPGYRGKIALALRGRDVVTVNAHAVFRNDTFKANFAKNDIQEHLPWRLAGAKDAGDCLGYYGIAELRSGSYLVAWIDRDEVEQIRQQTKKQRHGKDTPAWKLWPHEMGKKCAIHRLGKRMDLDPSAAAAFMRDDLLVTKTSEEPVVVNADPNDLSDLVDVKVGGKLDSLATEMEKEKEEPAKSREDNQEAVMRVKEIREAIAHMVGETRADELVTKYIKILVPDADYVALSEMNPESLMKLRDQLIVERKSIEKEREAKKSKKTPEEVKEEPFDPEEANAIRARLIWWIQHAAQEGCEVLTEYVDILGGVDGKPPILNEINEWDTAEKMNRIKLVFGSLITRFPELAKELKKAEQAAEKKEEKNGSDKAGG